MSEPAIVLDPGTVPAVVVTVPASVGVQVSTPGVVVIDNSSQVTISDDYVLTIGD